MSARDVIAKIDALEGIPFGYRAADAILSALRTAGFAVVPVEPTGAMCVAGGGAQQRSIGSWGEPKIVYRAMLKAAQEDS